MDAVLWWCIIDSIRITPTLWEVARAQRNAGAVVLLFIIGDDECIAAPPDAPLWFHLSDEDSRMALCVEAIIWSSLGATSHIALDWFDLRNVTEGNGKGTIWEITAATPDELTLLVEKALENCFFHSAYLHFEGTAMEGKDLKHIANLVHEKIIPEGSQVVTYEPGSSPEENFLRALMW